jgi:carbamate kinase|uniref:Carbamate kinase n=1 Tax=Ergobibamus cyprinoides TaxID=926446 RepID=A0A142D9Z8_9EUKA|nr:carbamate kinase [Ergobibamus cyprinoides]
MRVVIALGGNALLQRGQKGTWETQAANMDATAEALLKIHEGGHEVVLTHGNGPQVGAIKLQNEAAAHVSPDMPLFVCGAMSQGMIGFMMAQSITNQLRLKGDDTIASCIVTQTIVSPEDPAFQNPTKPIGRFYTAEEAQEVMATTGKTMKEDAGRGYRIIVPSPTPIDFVELPAIKALLAAGQMVVSSGGGGIPVLKKADGTFEGVDAVIDKDLSANYLAQCVAADRLVILTDVPFACINYNTPEQKNLETVTVAEMEAHVAAGAFAAGSMLPKVLACIRFVKATGNRAIITSLHSAVDALAGTTGTQICP